MFRDLYDHMEWADATVWRAVLAHSPAGTDKKIRDLLLHWHMTQRAFLLIWRDEELKFPPQESFTSADQVLAIARDYYADVAPLIARMDEEKANVPMVMPWAEQYHKPAHPTTLRDTLLQIPIHTAHHRGQALTRLRELGGEPPLVDYIAWVWLGKPHAEWPAADRH